MKEFLLKQPSLVDVSIPKESKFTVCGDIHGQFYDLLNIFELNGVPSETNPYLFNGDFVDRGSFSVECILTLFGFKLLYPNHFFMSRGKSDAAGEAYWQQRSGAGMCKNPMYWVEAESGKPSVLFTPSIPRRRCLSVLASRRACLCQRTT